MLENRDCPKCGIQFEVDTSGYVKTFCSRSCANSRSHSKEVKKKISKTQRNTWDSKDENAKQKTIEALRKGVKTIKENAKERLLVLSTEELGHLSRKQKVFEEQNESCSKCGIKDWLGEKLTFELEHIDGDRNNNKRNNLEVLCPNCHSQTKTWRGRNGKVYS